MCAVSRSSSAVLSGLRMAAIRSALSSPTVSGGGASWASFSCSLAAYSATKLNGIVSLLAIPPFLRPAMP